MKLIFATSLVSFLFSRALAQDSFNFEHINGSPIPSSVSTNQGVGYSIVYSNLWTQENHPYIYPTGDPHYSGFVWASHNTNYVMWADGISATRGVENVAEIGSTGRLEDEVEEEMEDGNVLSQRTTDFIDEAVEGATTETDDDDPLCVDRDHPYVSGIGMIAPSPDWFSGVYNLPLRDENTGTWYREVTVNVYAWDAGTEEGDEYRFSNPATPNGLISPFMAGDTADAVFVSVKNNGNLRVLPVGTITLQLVEESDCTTEPEEPEDPVDSTESFFVRRNNGRLRERTCNWASRGGRRRCDKPVRDANGQQTGQVVRDLCPVACDRR